MTTSEFNHSTRPGLDRRPWIIVAAVLALAFIAGTWGAMKINQLNAEKRQLEEQIAELKMVSEIKILEDNLKAPMEAIVRSPEPWPKWEEGRRPVLEEAGITHYSQFATVYLTGAKHFDLPTDMSRKSHLVHVDVSGSMSNSSYEMFWHNFAPNSCDKITFFLKADVPIGEHLRAHPEIFEERLRPLLLRLVRSTERRTRLAACKTLITGGDRTEAMLDVVREFVAEPLRRRRDSNNEWVMRFSNEKEECLKLIEEYKLEIPIPDSENGGTA